MMKLEIPAQVSDLINAGALFVINDSAGKDSQAMKALLLASVPRAQLLIVHVHLKGEEWDGTTDHVRRYACDVPVLIVEPVKTFAEMVERRGMFPSPKQRQCTSDLKRGPIEREVRRYLKANPQFGGLVVNCMGMRAQESPGRSKLEPFKYNPRNSKAGREWFDWLPIHGLTKAEVFEVIADAGQEPHFAYGLGMSRLSCMFCIMSSAADLKIAAQANPAAYRERVLLERRVGHTINMECRPLDQVAGIPIAEEA